MKFALTNYQQFVIEIVIVSYFIMISSLFDLIIFNIYGFHSNLISQSSLFKKKNFFVFALNIRKNNCLEQEKYLVSLKFEDSLGR